MEDPVSIKKNKRFMHPAVRLAFCSQKVCLSTSKAQAPKPDPELVEEQEQWFNSFGRYTI